MPAARTAAKHARLAIVMGLCAESGNRALGVAQDLGAGNAALRPHLGGDAVGVTLARAAPSHRLWHRRRPSALPVRFRSGGR